jgi:flagellar protein FliL
MAKDAEPAAREAGAESAAPPAAPRRALLKKLVLPLSVVASLGTGAAAMPGGAARNTPLEGAGAGSPEAAPPAAAAPASGAPPQYLALSPAFVVNLKDDEAMRYLQLEVEVMARDAAALDAVKTHMPVIRNNLLLLMGQKGYFELDTREGKEALRGEMLGEIQEVLTAETGAPGVEAIYFNSFVMQ